MIPGLASPTYSGILPARRPLLWLLDRCAAYGLRALEAPLPLSGADDPADAARAILPRAVAVALKDVRVFPNRSNDITIWGAPLGRGSVDFDTLLPLLARTLPDPENTPSPSNSACPPAPLPTPTGWRRASRFSAPIPFSKRPTGEGSETTSPQPQQNPKRRSPCQTAP